ncbi:hypothetical protein CYMTET_47102 [Cymbomonas tetramitiformis]|uniref:Uncharacterized protein n=1 Tax=Cymbomonas tetramitiformis TaxID=36881 RepID=A0AAE0EWB6_9CHLO|nr:hypothetical protein CYMTET_47102 [Cymbomonas tetramitiformis]
MSSKVPVISAASMDEGDFTPFVLELNAYLCDLITSKNLKRFSAGEDLLTKDDVNVPKAVLFSTPLQTMFRNTSSECEAVRSPTFLLEPNVDGKTGVRLIMKDGEDYPADAGFMTDEPLTYTRDGPFRVVDDNGTVDYDAAWHALFYMLQLKFAAPSAYI